jgi:hypothetical protein
MLDNAPGDALQKSEVTHGGTSQIGVPVTAGRSTLQNLPEITFGASQIFLQIGTLGPGSFPFQDGNSLSGIGLSPGTFLQSKQGSRAI